MMPGRMGASMPLARTACTNASKTSKSKNICVMMQSLPAETLAAR
jgi:hypothetical protein